VHELEELVDDRLEELPVRAEELGVLPDHVPRGGGGRGGSLEGEGGGRGKHAKRPNSPMSAWTPEP
jgi:hypothetical protein